MTRLGNFWKFFATNFFQKYPKRDVTFWAIEKVPIQEKNTVAIFWVTGEKVWLLLLNLATLGTMTQSAL